MPTTILKTRTDVVEHLMDWSGSQNPDATMLRQIHRAIEAAYREIPQSRNWACYQRRARKDTVASYSTGTITYTHSSRLVTLASGTWPSWAALGVIRIAGIEYEVASRTDDDEIILSVNNNPGADVAAGTSYVIYRRDYPLPVDFQAMGRIRNAATDCELVNLTSNDLLGGIVFNPTPAEPTAYSIQGDPNYIGAMGIAFDPPPNAIYHFDYLYRRRPRQFTTYQYNTGTVVTASMTLTGTGTTFLSKMIGCVIRFGSTTELPTGSHGTNPFVANRIITGYTSATVLTLDQALDAELSGVKFEISDPIDIESGAMYTAFLRWAEYELATAVRRDDAAKLYNAAREALLVAGEEDRRTIERPSQARWRSRVPTYYGVTNDTD